jgi:ribosomal protein S18 acetylase RimI-like enzyme
MENTQIAVRDIEPADREWVRAFLQQHFGSTRVVSRNVLHQADDLPGFIATYRGEPSALLTYCVVNGELEVVSLHAAVRGRGLGSRLLASARERARDLRCRRLWLITTNDNEPAIRFYTRRACISQPFIAARLPSHANSSPRFRSSASVDARLSMRSNSSDALLEQRYA